MPVILIVLVFVMIKILVAPVATTTWERIKEEAEYTRGIDDGQLRTYQPKAYRHEGMQLGDAVGYGISRLQPRDATWLWIIAILLSFIIPVLGIIMIISLIVFKVGSLGPYTPRKEKLKPFDYKSDENHKYEQQTC